MLNQGSSVITGIGLGKFLELNPRSIRQYDFNYRTRRPRTLLKPKVASRLTVIQLKHLAYFSKPFWAVGCGSVQCFKKAKIVPFWLTFTSLFDCESNKQLVFTQFLSQHQLKLWKRLRVLSFYICRIRINFRGWVKMTSLSYAVMRILSDYRSSAVLWLKPGDHMRDLTRIRSYTSELNLENRGRIH